MKEYKKWITFLILSTKFLVICIICMSVFANPYGVFNKKVMVDRIYGAMGKANARYMKIEYLLKNRERYNSFIVGGSRAGVIKSNDFEKYFIGSKVYNLSVPGASIEENYLTINFLLNNFKVENIVLQLGMDQMAEYGMNTGINKIHYKVTGESSNLFYINYLTIVNLKDIFNSLINEREKNDIYNNDGTWPYQLVENRIKDNEKKYYNKQKDFFLKNERTKNGNRIKESVSYIKKIKELCDFKKVKLTVFLVPHNHQYIDNYDKNDYLEYIKEIAKVCEFWDFNGYNSITVNDKNYYETSHFRYFVGDMIIEKMCNKNNKNIPSDFGVYVTKKNLYEHLRYLNKNFDNWDKKRGVEH